MTEAMPAASPERQRLLVLGGICVAVLLAALVLPRVLFGGGGDDADGVAAPPSTVPEGVSQDDAGPVEDPTVVPEATFSTKNPFTPLVATGDPAAAGATDTSGSTTDAAPPDDVPADATGVTDGSAATNGSAATDGTSATGGTMDPSGTEPDRAAVRLSLVDVYAGPDGAAVATVQVDGAYFTVAEGEAFGDGYQVVSLSQSSRSGVFSQDGQRFTVREGEARLK